jgi:hypothetical protein
MKRWSSTITVSAMSAQKFGPAAAGGIQCTAWHIASVNLPQLNKRNSVVIFSANHQLVLTCIRVLLPLFLPAGRRPPER